MCAENNHQSKLTQDFIKLSKEKFPNSILNYDKVVYINSATPVDLFCFKNNHGWFQQTPKRHFKGISGCPFCGIEDKKSILLTLDDFITKAKKTHVDKYDYSKSIYLGQIQDIEIICLVDLSHGSFWQTPKNHWNGANCPKCGIAARYNHFVKPVEKFIESAKLIHIDDNGNHKYNYSLVKYINGLTPVDLLCIKHKKVFSQSPKSHLSGSGCRECGIENRSKLHTKELEQFIFEANILHNFKYDYSKFIYITSKTKGEIICPNHGSFHQAPNPHLRKSEIIGCPRCGGKQISGPEKYWLDNIIKLPSGPDYRNVCIRDIGDMWVDGLDASSNTIYEFYGDYFHGNLNIFKSTDLNKKVNKTFQELYDKTIAREKIILNSGYKLITIWENEFLEKYSIEYRLYKKELKKLESIKNNNLLQSKLAERSANGERSPLVSEI